MFVSFHKSLLLPRHSSDLIDDFLDLLHTELKKRERRGERREEGGRKERKKSKECERREERGEIPHCSFILSLLSQKRQTVQVQKALPNKNGENM